MSDDTTTGQAGEDAPEKRLAEMAAHNRENLERLIRRGGVITFSADDGFLFDELGGVPFEAVDFQPTLEELDTLRPRLAAAEALADRLAEALRSIAALGCRVSHGGYPRGSTCIDVRKDAIDLKFFHAYAEPYRQALIDGKHLCVGCRARAALVEHDAGRGR